MAADRFATHHGYNLAHRRRDAASALSARGSRSGSWPRFLYFRARRARRRDPPVLRARRRIGRGGVRHREAARRMLGGRRRCGGPPAQSGVRRALAVVMTEVPALAFLLAGCWLLPRGPRKPTRDRASAAGGASRTQRGFALRSVCLAILLPFAWRILTQAAPPLGAIALLALPFALGRRRDVVGTTRRRFRAGSAPATTTGARCPTIFRG